MARKVEIFIIWIVWGVFWFAWRHTAASVWQAVAATCQSMLRHKVEGYQKDNSYNLPSVYVQLVCDYKVLYDC